MWSVMLVCSVRCVLSSSLDSQWHTAPHAPRNTRCPGKESRGVLFKGLGICVSQCMWVKNKGNQYCMGMRFQKHCTGLLCGVCVCVCRVAVSLGKFTYCVWGISCRNSRGVVLLWISTHVGVFACICVSVHGCMCGVPECLKISICVHITTS